MVLGRKEQQQTAMLVKAWRKGDPYALLVELQIGAATKEKTKRNTNFALFTQTKHEFRIKNEKNYTRK